MTIREKRVKQLMKRDWIERTYLLKRSKKYWFDWAICRATTKNNEEGA
jgi:hypothetical protein